MFLTSERIAALDAIGMVWNISDFIWERNFAAAKKYYNQYGDLDVPLYYVDAEGIRLGRWITGQRKHWNETRKNQENQTEKEKKKGITQKESNKQKITIQEIEHDWEIPKKNNETENKLLKNKKTEESNAEDKKIPGEEIKQSKMQEKSSKISLTRDQVDRLTAIGMNWDGKSYTTWEKSYVAACEYYKEHGNLDVPANYRSENGYQLGRWIRRQREVYGQLVREWYQRKNNSELLKENDSDSYFTENPKLQANMELSAVKSQNIENENFDFHRDKQELKNQIYQNSFKNKEEKQIRSNDREGQQLEIYSSKINFTRIQKLEQIGMIWDGNYSWEKKFQLAKQYFKEHGNLKMPSDYVVEGVWLDRWLREQKKRMQEDIKFEKEIQKDKRKEETKDLKFNTEKNNFTEKTADHTKKEWNKKAADCINKEFRKTSEKESKKETNQDKNTEHFKKKTGKPLTAIQKEKLQSIGIQPGVSQVELAWKQQYNEAKEFYNKHGNLSVPKRYLGTNGRNLGVWLQRQREGKRNGRLSGWQVACLEGIGMIWESDLPWQTGLNHAKTYVQENGDLAVPNNYICKDGYRLGKWISNQRLAYHGGSGKPLDQEQIRQLEEIGMIWRAKPGRAKKR